MKLNWNFERWRTRDRLIILTNVPIPSNPTQNSNDGGIAYGEHNDETRPAG